MRAPARERIKGAHAFALQNTLRNYRGGAGRLFNPAASRLPGRTRLRQAAFVWNARDGCDTRARTPPRRIGFIDAPVPYRPEMPAPEQAVERE
jgi:hypothetical protein